MFELCATKNKSINWLACFLVCLLQISSSFCTETSSQGNILTFNLRLPNINKTEEKKKTENHHHHPPSRTHVSLWCCITVQDRQGSFSDPSIPLLLSSSHQTFPSVATGSERWNSSTWRPKTRFDQSRGSKVWAKASHPSSRVHEENPAKTREGCVLLMRAKERGEPRMECWD